MCAFILSLSPSIGNIAIKVIGFFLPFFSHPIVTRCTPPNKGNDYQKIYSDWCHEFEKYKSAMKTWEKKQAVSNKFHMAFAHSI